MTKFFLIWNNIDTNKAYKIVEIEIFIYRYKAFAYCDF